MTLAFLFSALMLTSPAKAGLLFTIDKPGVQSSQVAGTQIVETFDDWSRGTFRTNQKTSFGEYVVQGTPKVLSARLWGGAGGTGNYLFISPKNSTKVTLNFDSPVGYFGFWWSAGDRGNLLQVNTSIGMFDFTTKSIFNSLEDLTPYKGNPTDNFKGKNPKQPYGYINLFAQSDDYKIKSIMFHGSNFETDNHTIVYERQQPTGTTIESVAVSEPESLGLFALAALPFLYMRRRIG